MNEALAFPNLEASADAWHVYPMTVLDSGLVIVMLGVDSVLDVIAVIDEVNPIMSHDPLLTCATVECVGGFGDAGVLEDALHCVRSTHVSLKRRPG